MQTARQKEIIEVALELINEKGIQGLTIKNLSKKIGITEPAIYRHYDSKTDILIAVLDLFKQNTEQLFEKELQNEGKAMGKIEHLLTNHFTSFSATPSLVSVIFSEEIFRNEAILIDKIAEIIEKNDKILTTIIVNGQKTGELRTDIEAKYLSVIIMGTLRLFVKKWQFSAFSYNLPNEGKKLIESIKLLIIKE
ncbi:MAG TPA: TetR/AcrR family transcriptional regulator [Candidatus Cloacimonetes bacterium]|nr:TetR/AcrR family transcriptional regulator [Candidatus Cloacimonadota bacterium]